MDATARRVESLPGPSRGGGLRPLMETLTMSEIKRISVEEGVALFERAGMAPKTGEYFDNDRCGCVVGALVVAADGFEETIRLWNDDVLDYNPADRAKQLGYEGEYIGGLMTGFDTPGLASKVLAKNDERFSHANRLGMADGIAIRQRVLPIAEGGAA